MAAARAERLRALAAGGDPLLYEDAQGEPLPGEEALPFGDPQAPLHAAALTLAEQLTGVGISEDWLLREHDAAVIRRR